MEAVNQYGTLLDNYITKNIKINCYAIDKFFVEVVYNAEHNTITEVRSFKTPFHIIRSLFVLLM
jgi:hypothetical protein